MRSFQKLDMASTDWLTTHFLAKSPDRAREINSLSIPRGARVLDLCCGPGLYMPRLLDMVGPDGHVTGADQDPISLDSAHARLSAQPHRNWELKHARLEELLPQVGAFDVVLIFNSIGYFDDPLAIIRSIATALQPGSKVIIKDFDLEGFFFQPRNIEAWSQLLISAKKKDDGDNPVSFSNFLGRRVHALHRAFPFREHFSETWTQQMAFPFNAYQTEYIWRNIECLIQQAGDGCPPETVQYFKDAFYPPDASFFADEQAMFVETEYLITLTV